MFLQAENDTQRTEVHVHKNNMQYMYSCICIFCIVLYCITVLPTCCAICVLNVVCLLLSYMVVVHIIYTAHVYILYTYITTISQHCVYSRVSVHTYMYTTL